MANLLTSNPIRIDTVMGSSYKGAVAATLGTLFTLMVHHIEWVGEIASSNQVLVVDPGSGIELFHMIASAANVPVIVDWSAKPRLWRDFQVVQLDSGRLDIFTV